ncbi:MAG: HAMP domain-containing histidine kinase [Planctomycetaceae bacterium]|nr:HAMP domain-containing histidine kinase [Planctomycetaceae bacterium]
MAGAVLTGWLSFQAMQNERQRMNESRRAERERVALWRMESRLLPMISEESLWDVERPDQVPHEFVVTRFQMMADGSIIQFDAGSGHADPQSIQKGWQSELDRSGLLATLSETYGLIETGQYSIVPSPVSNHELLTLPAEGNVALTQVQQSNTDFLQRLNATQMSNSLNISVVQGNLALPVFQPAPGPRVACWNNKLLLLVSLRQQPTETLVEGSVLNWDKIRTTLRTELSDLLPNADLIPLAERAVPDDHALVTIPAVLIPGELPADSLPFWSPMRVTVVIAWLGLTICAVATGVVLIQTDRISRRRAEFVAAVSHELRTPLTTFQIYTDLLADTERLTDEKREQYLATLKRETRRLTGLVDNVLGFARMESASQAVQTESLSWPTFVQSQLPAWNERARQARVTLQVLTAQTARIRIAAHPGSLERILFNLIDNGCKYAGGTDTQKDHCPVIQVSCRINNLLAEVRVTDCGPGVHPDALRNLFRPFSKSVTEAARTRPGVGLGLYLSQQLARQMNGRLELESTSSSGTTFRLTLPLGIDN